jgi:hypothetical protein
MEKHTLAPNGVKLNTFGVDFLLTQRFSFRAHFLMRQQVGPYLRDGAGEKGASG